MRPILAVPDPALRVATRSVKFPDGQLRRLVDDLIVTMRLAKGLGLAAPQIGSPLSVAVVESEGRLYVLGNPVIESAGPTVTDWEGCLSVPDRVAKVARAGEIVVHADDVDGRRIRHRATGLLARAFLHEIDHLAGRLYVDLVEPGSLVDTTLHPTPPQDGA